MPVCTIFCTKGERTAKAFIVGFRNLMNISTVYS